mmetsp:Transcript_21845/g.37314  ORF Transcript_21845/g.37314 Transcript_21845/m.37314 type:complete len:251 (+) Transcript_21845:871-1623(+)
MRSVEMVGMARIMYVGSMYFMSASARYVEPVLISFLSHGPMSLRMGLPLASTPLLLPSSSRSCPAPSATHTTQCPFALTTPSRYLSRPFSPCSLKGTSGMRQASTTPDAIEACMAMKPDCLPMSFTRPTPLRALLASTLAANSARCASSTAVSNPKHLSINRMSLSIDFGMPTTEQLTSCCWHMAWIALAPALPPFPPTTNNISTPHMSKRFTISRMFAPPRLVPRMVPPCSWMPSTLRRVSTMGLVVVS